MQRCKLCVMVSTRPDHTFVDGVCPACINAKKKKEIDWAAKEKELDQLLDRFHGECIVPSSGGKDSTAQAIILKNKGAHVTAVTARTCDLTPIGRANINNLAKHVNTVEYTPNMTVRGKLNRMGLELVGDISLPEHFAIFTTPFQASQDLGIPLIMYGENSQLEYGGPEDTEYATQLTERWRSELGGFCGVRPSDFVGQEGITQRDMYEYMLPDDLGHTEAHFLGAYMPWDSHSNAILAKENGMLQRYPCYRNYWSSENLDNYQVLIHDYFMYLKFGYGRGCSQISVDIRNGLVSRDEALMWVQLHDSAYPDFYLGKTLEAILENINLTPKQFWEIANQYDLEGRGHGIS